MNMMNKRYYEFEKDPVRREWKESEKEKKEQEVKRRLLEDSRRLNSAPRKAKDGMYVMYVWVIKE